MSELVEPYWPGIVGGGAGSPAAGGGGGKAGTTIELPGAKPGGFGSEVSSSNPKAAWPASYNPPLSPIRGSSDDARGLVKTVDLDAVGATVCAAHGTGKDTDSESEKVRALIVTARRGSRGVRC